MKMSMSAGVVDLWGVKFIKLPYRYNPALLQP